jgi:hypothetical protein
MSGIVEFFISIIVLGLIVLWLYWNTRGVLWVWYKLRGGYESIRPMGYLVWFVGTWILLPLLVTGVAFIGELV